MSYLIYCVRQETVPLTVARPQCILGLTRLSANAQTRFFLDPTFEQRLRTFEQRLSKTFTDRSYIVIQTLWSRPLRKGLFTRFSVGELHAASKISSANGSHLNVWYFDISAAEFPQQKKTCVFGVNRPIQTKDARYFRRVLSVPEHSHLSRKTLDTAWILPASFYTLWIDVMRSPTKR